MKKMRVDVGKEKIEFGIPECFTYEILNPESFPAIGHLKTAVGRALGHPISSTPLKQLGAPGAKAALIINDNTRYVPQHIIVPEILEALTGSGICKEDITLVIATGTHRPNTDQEIADMLGEEIPYEFRVINHSAYDEGNLVKVGESRKGSIPIVINKAVAEADIKIGIGVIEPHLFAGYSGGAKILSVGVAGIDTIAATHNAEMLEHPSVRYGVVRGNVFREFLNEVAERVGLDFIVNIVMGADKEVLGVFAGNPIIAYEEGVDFAERVYRVKAARQADVVVTVPQYPKNINLYQAIRAANGVVFGEKPLVKKGGTIIIPARCWDGVGSRELLEDLSGVKDPKEIIARARQKGFPPEGHKSFTVSRILQHCSIYITDTDIPEEVITALHLDYAGNAADALKRILREGNKDSSCRHIAVLTDGITTIPKLTV